MKKKNKPKDAYFINRIRLINFHNFVDELIEVRNGGHLFLLGDNGCGKTTVIDAIHYVLTAGINIEFNSAARVVGRRSEGRRPQGIISRYNVGRGHMNPDGAVTYAALELTNGGRTTVLAVGMSINSPEDNLTRWGVIRDCPLEEIPFLIDDLNGRRPAGKFEIREALQRNGYFGQMGQYAKVVADRFAGGQETYEEFCNFLHMCKAYREIVSNSSDYHSLFKKLLPEKRIDLFETIINALRDIETSTGELDELNRKLDYIADLESKVEDVRQAAGELICFRYAGVQHNIERFNRKLDNLKIDRTVAQKELAECQETLTAQEAEREQTQKLLADLQAKDSEGLIEKQKTFLKQQEELTARLALLVEQEQKDNTAVTALKQAETARREEVKTALSTQLAACSRLSPQLPFSTATYIQALDELIHEPVVQSLDALPLENMRSRADESFAEHHQKLGRQQDLLKERRETENNLLQNLAEMRNTPEATPEVAGFADAKGTLHQAMVEAVPLYRNLEWAVDISDADRSQIEEAIGEEVLSTFIVRENDWTAACDAVFPEFPGIRLAKRREVEPKTELADWIRQSFDFDSSDPEAMLVLHNEMISAHQQQPTFTKAKSRTMLAFRAHSRSLNGRPARLIGEIARRQEQQRRIAAREEELKACRTEIADLNRALAEMEKAEGALKEFRTLLHSGVEELHRRFEALNATHRELQSASANLVKLSQDTEVTRNELTSCDERIVELRRTLEEKGLAQLEERLTACRRRYEKAQTQCNESRIRSGQIQQRLADLSRDIDECQPRLESQEQRHAEIADELRAFCGEGGFKPYLDYVRSNWDYANQDEFNALYEEAKTGRRALQATIEERLRLPEASPYGFVYDRDENHLYDRSQCGIGDLVASLKKSIHEQEEVINDKTTELFRNVVQNSLVRFIIENITRLRDMVKDINGLLGDRAFGMNSYRLQLTPLKEYERFVETFQNFSTFNADSTRELKELLEDYRDEILSTEVNTIPTVLDYRNWFRYEMRVSTAGDAEGEVITRRLRSIGSGGEQAVPNYLLIMTIAHFLYRRSRIRTHVMLFDEAFYGIDEERRNQLLGFAGDLGLQLFVASPDQDGVRREVAYSTSVFVLKDEQFDVHLYPNYFENPNLEKQLQFFEEPEDHDEPYQFESELSPYPDESGDAN